MRGVIGVLFYSVIALAPILAGVFIASRLLRDPRAPHRSRRSGGRHRVLGGWCRRLGLVPAQWAGSFWTTVEAAGNAAKYGHSFQHAAEHVLFYSRYSARLGGIAFGVAGLTILRLVSGRPSALLLS
jgi:hypothetical protein